MNEHSHLAELLIVENGLRELRDLPPGDEQVRRRDDDLALGKNNPIFLAAIPDTHVSVARVLLENIRDVIRRDSPSQLGSRMHSHFHLRPQPEGKTSTPEHISSSKFDTAPHYYGVLLFQFGNFATGARAA